MKYNKADWNKDRDATKQLATNYLERVPDNLTVEENGAVIESGLQDIIDQEIPSKLSRSKETYQWSNHCVKKAKKNKG